MTTAHRVQDERHVTSGAWADEQVEAALRVLSDHHAREFEASRREREHCSRQKVAEWLRHADCCEERASGYLSDAARFCASHKDHHYYLRLANEQLAKAADVRRWAEIERNSL